MQSQYVIKYKKKYYTPDFTNKCNFFKSSDIQEAKVFLVDENDFTDWSILICDTLMFDLPEIKNKSDILFCKVYISLV